MDRKAVFRLLKVVHEVDLGLSSVLSNLNCLLAGTSCTRGCSTTHLMGTGSSITLTSARH